MSIAWGVEVSLDGETGAVVAARSRPRPSASPLWRLECIYYHDATGLPAALGAAYDAEEEAVGVFVDPMPCAPVLEALSRLMWVHRLEAVDVAASAAQFRMAVKAREVGAVPHPALEQALTFALQRQLAAAFAFERSPRRVAADMSPLNAAAFALWGLRRSEASDARAVVI